MRLKLRQAKLPENLEEFTIDMMTVGDVGYTTPWAMWVDMERNCWLHPKYPLERSPHGTIQMRVELREDGYSLTIPRRGYVWSVQKEPGYMSPADTKYIPVAAFKEETR